MCGIAGIYSSKNNLSTFHIDKMKAALALQAHRGPDATDLYAQDSIIMGHNRLSIIDLSNSADQPMHRKDLGLSIIFNGEIYNYKALKSELEELGYAFYTHSDTEVLLVGFHAFGVAICQKLVGMFAFSIWSNKKKELLIVRDRFGEKPIFFIEDGDEFLFASELNALRKLYGKPLTINQNAVIDLMENLYINTHHSIYQEVSVFPPATHLLISESGAQVWNNYYKFPTVVKEPVPFEELKSITKEKLYSSIANELHADVPVATFLSAGVDSGLITSIAKDIKPDITAVTMATNESATDETEGATNLAKKLNIKHEIVPVDTDSLEVLAKILKDIQPLADASLIPTHLVTDKVKGNFTVMLSGDGGDELFGSYNRPNMFMSIGQKPIPFGEKLIDFGYEGERTWLKTKLGARLTDRNRLKIAGWSGYYARTNLSGGLFSQVFRSGTSQNRVKAIFQELEPLFVENPEKVCFGIDYKSKLPGGFLYKVDSAAMHSSIEVRAPFMDHELVDYFMQVPTRSLMPHAIDKELPKALLSEYTGSTWHPPKRGFTIPYWVYLQHEWGDTLETFLREGKSEELLNFNKEGILNLLKSHRQHSSPVFARVLFAILVLEIWLRVFHLEEKELVLDKITIGK